MSLNPKKSPGKISIHAAGLGEVTPAEIKDRATEIAVMEGRSEPTEDDRTRAIAELRGETLPETNESDAATMDSLSRDPSDPPAHHGRQIPNQEEDDDQNTERLVSEGVDEATSDQMLTARRKRPS